VWKNVPSLKGDAPDVSQGPSKPFSHFFLHCHAVPCSGLQFHAVRFFLSLRFTKNLRYNYPMTDNHNRTQADDQRPAPSPARSRMNDHSSSSLSYAPIFGVAHTRFGVANHILPAIACLSSAVSVSACEKPGSSRRQIEATLVLSPPHVCVRNLGFVYLFSWDIEISAQPSQKLFQEKWQGLAVIGSPWQQLTVGPPPQSKTPKNSWYSGSHEPGSAGRPMGSTPWVPQGQIISRKS
jgi:hypothetical protein